MTVTFNTANYTNYAIANQSKQALLKKQASYNQGLENSQKVSFSGCREDSYNQEIAKLDRRIEYLKKAYDEIKKEEAKCRPGSDYHLDSLNIKESRIYSDLTEAERDRDRLIKMRDSSLWDRIRNKDGLWG
ncbi:MAG: hypothetical protein ACD_20C00325G0003 [uncultured bacterium]|nr:MAG: hypothetical protein ACD_20C00325G0003 [uncultured bacterium]